MQRNRARDAVVAAVGAVVILAAAATLLVVEQRAGPYEAALVPAVQAAVATGSYEATPGQEPALPGLCDVPDACRPPQTSLTWRIEGLADPPGGAVYAAWLAAQPVQSLGSLQRDGDAYVVSHASQRFHAADALHLVLTRDAGHPDGPHLVLHEVPVAKVGRTGLAGTFDAGPGGIFGSARFTQIGAAETSLLADVVLQAPEMPGLEYRVWLMGDRIQYLGALHFGGKGVLDARIERIHAAPGDRVVVYLAAEGSASPTGLPVANGVVA